MNLTPEEQSVYDLISQNKRITQLQLSRQVFVGCHEKFEAYDKPKASTLRKVRQIIRDLRIKHDKAILSDSDGYWVMKDKKEAEKYIKRLEQSARSQAKSLMVTYEVMRKNFGVTNAFFESNEILVREHKRRKKKDEVASDISQANIFDL